MDLTKIKNIFTLFVLFVASYASLATSDGKFNLVSGSLIISSDCVSPARIDNAIMVSNNEIIDPAATSYLDFGFPESVVGELGVETESGVVDGKNRVCKISYQIDESIWVYTCSDNGEYACTITLETN